MDRVSPSMNPPTVATLLTAFVTALVDWGWSVIPDTVPTTVRETGYALVLAALAIGIGKFAQRYTWPGSTIEEFGLDAEAILNSREAASKAPPVVEDDSWREDRG